MKLWYVCEALARQKLGLGDEYTLYAADMHRKPKKGKPEAWEAVAVGIGRKEGEHWTDKHADIIIYRHEIETFPDYTP